MQPIRLYMKNFCAHVETEFCFNDFQSALIIGKVKNNDRFSNGAGKSTIFNAIEYVLFNEVHFSALEKVIRDGCDVCRVEFDFISSLDKNVYRIVRSNSRKAGTDVRLFKKSQNDEWEDLTQRRVSDTEKEIIKIVGFNYKAFCASVLFSQFGSENNVQKDFGNLPYLTPEKRKSVLREVLQLNVYANYEKLAKTKYNGLVTDLEKQKNKLETYLETDGKDILLVRSQVDLLNKFAQNKIELENADTRFQIVNEELSIIKEQYLSFNTKFSELSKNKILCESALKNSQILINDTNKKISSILDNVKRYKDNMEKCSIENEALKILSTDITACNTDLEQLVPQINDNRSKVYAVNLKIKEYEAPITDEQVCSHCHQIVSPEHKLVWRQVSKESIDQLSISKDILEQDYLTLSMREKMLKSQIETTKKYNDTLETNKLTIAWNGRDIDKERDLYKTYNSFIEDQKLIQNEKNIEYKNIEQELNLELSSKINFQNNLDALTAKSVKIKNELSDYYYNKNKLTAELAVIEHQIEICYSNKEKAIEIKRSILESEKAILLYSKVVQAFGSNGIPALITHSILDELQEEANKWLLKLRPGLQLQFIVNNDKDKKEKEDTLDILYFIDGNQREYKQLSGAQKIIVSLAIKLSLLCIMNKRLGVDIKLILLDEVDQALDPGSTEIFADIIKVIQDEFKVMVITHDEELKHKFSHAILVEQDENNMSRGKLINW